MNTILGIYRNLIIVLVVICIAAACTPIDSTFNPSEDPTSTHISTQESATSTVTQEISPTTAETEVATPTQTATMVAPTEAAIDFEIPAAPAEADPEIWRTAYINGMQTNGLLKRKIEAGLATYHWDQRLNTLVWEVGDERFGYNTEFAFTGDIVKDVYNNDWIVRKKLTQGQGDASSIWRYSQLHHEGELIMGAQCIQRSLGPTCGLVGQVIGQEVIDMKPFLVSNFDSLSDVEKGEMYQNMTNFDTHFLVVRVPNASGFSDIKVPVCPSDYCDSKMAILIKSRRTDFVSGNEFIDLITPGKMVYVFFGIMTPGMGIDWKAIMEESRKDQNVFDADRFMSAFGMSELLDKTLNKEFGITIGIPHVDNYDGSVPVFDFNKLANVNIVQPLGAFLIK